MRVSSLLFALALLRVLSYAVERSVVSALVLRRGGRTHDPFLYLFRCTIL